MAPVIYAAAVADGRPSIPAALRRAVLVEAGHRCAIPTCKQTPVVLDHIDDWAKVRQHAFENLIALCPNCHQRKTSGEIDRQSMLQYKANLSVIGSRYTQLERQILELLGNRPSDRVVHLPAAASLLLYNLLRDDLIAEPWWDEDEHPVVAQVVHRRAEGRPPGRRARLSTPYPVLEWCLTERGREVAHRYLNALPID